MAILAKEGERKVIHLPPAKNMQAVCFDVWDLGLQATEFKGDKRVQRKIKVGFELNARIDSQDAFNGKRYRIFKDYTLSLGEKANLRKDLAAWLGRQLTAEELKGGFDTESLVGTNCLLNIIHKSGQDGAPRAKVSAITALLDGMAPIAAETPRETPQWIADVQARAVQPETAAA